LFGEDIFGIWISSEGEFIKKRNTFLVDNKKQIIYSLNLT